MLHPIPLDPFAGSGLSSISYWLHFVPNSLYLQPSSEDPWVGGPLYSNSQKVEVPLAGPVANDGLVQESESPPSCLQVGQTLLWHECSRARRSPDWGWDLTWNCTLASRLRFHYLAFPLPTGFSSAHFLDPLDRNPHLRVLALGNPISEKSKWTQSLLFFFNTIRVCEVSSVVRGSTHPPTHPSPAIPWKTQSQDRAFSPSSLCYQLPGANPTPCLDTCVCVISNNCYVSGAFLVCVIKHAVNSADQLSITWKWKGRTPNKGT